MNLLNVWDGWLLVGLIIVVVWAVAAVFSYAIWQLVAAYNVYHYEGIEQKYRAEYQRYLQQLQRNREPDELVLFREFLAEQELNDRKYMN